MDPPVTEPHFGALSDAPHWANRAFSIHEWFLMNDPAYPAHLRPNWFDSVSSRV